MPLKAMLSSACASGTGNKNCGNGARHRLSRGPSRALEPGAREGELGAARTCPTWVPRMGGHARPRLHPACEWRRKTGARHEVAHGGGGGGLADSATGFVPFIYSSSDFHVSFHVSRALAPHCLLILAPSSPSAGALSNRRAYATDRCFADPQTVPSLAGWRGVGTPTKRLKSFRGVLHGGCWMLRVKAGARSGIGPHELGKPRAPTAREATHKIGAIHGGCQTAGGVASKAARLQRRSHGRACVQAMRMRPCRGAAARLSLHGSPFPIAAEELKYGYARLLSFYARER